MTKLAIDVVLLPEPEIAQKCIALNRALVHEFISEIVLDAETCLPHCSLAMGVMAEETLPEVAARLQRILGATPVEPLRAAGIGSRKNSRGHDISGVQLESTPSLKTLHERIMTDLEPLLSRTVKAPMLHGDDIANTTLDWIRDYRTQSSFEHFSPHITLGYGRLADGAFPSPFRARSLAVCHLGNHCTCRRVLWESVISDQ